MFIIYFDYWLLIRISLIISAIRNELKDNLVERVQINNKLEGLLQQYKHTIKLPNNGMNRICIFGK